MKIAENCWLARAVLAVVIIVCILLSGGGRLKGLQEKALDVFYGEDGIDGDLTRRCESALLLAGLAESYGLDETAVARVNDAALAAQEGTIAERGDGNRSLTLAVDQLYTLMDQADLSDTDAAYAYSLYKEVQSRAQIMARSEYDVLAQEYNRVIDGFPAGLIASLTGLDALDAFH